MVVMEVLVVVVVEKIQVEALEALVHLDKVIMGEMVSGDHLTLLVVEVVALVALV